MNASNHYSSEIERLYEAQVWGLPCPVGEMMTATSADDQNYSCPIPTCPVCNYCFKYHHPRDRHAEPGEEL